MKVELPKDIIYRYSIIKEYYCVFLYILVILKKVMEPNK